MNREIEIPEGYEARIEGNKVILEPKDSEDERLRRLLVWQVHRNIEDETNDLAKSVYDGIKGHDPDLEESIEDWKKCLAYLERQKEQKHAGWSEEDEEMYARVVRRYTDYEGVIMRTKEESIANKMLDAMAQEEIWLKSLRPQPKQEWSKEDKRCFDEAIEALESLGFDGEASNLKSLRDNYKKCNCHWKPSEKQINMLGAIVEREKEKPLYGIDGYSPAAVLESLYNDLKKL